MFDKIKNMDQDTRQTYIVVLLLLSVFLFVFTIISANQAIEKTNEYNERLEEKGCLNIQQGQNTDLKQTSSETVHKNIYNKQGVKVVV